MENNELKNFFDLDKLRKQKAVCKISNISTRLEATPAPGLPTQHFFTLSLIGQNNREEGAVKRISAPGFKISKTFFELTHPDAYQVIEEWKADHVEGTAYDQEVEGYLVTVPTKREFVMQTRDRKEGSATKGKLIDLVGNDGKVRTASAMTFFILSEGESEEGEMRRRGTQLEKLNKWLKKETSHAVSEVDEPEL